MKGILIAGFFLTASLAALAQGKVNLISDEASLVVLGTDTKYLLPADRSLAGQAVGNMVPLPSGITLVAGLYAGTSSANLFLYSTVAMTRPNTPGGYIPATHIKLTAQPNGAPDISGIAYGTPIGPTTPWFQVKIWDSTFPTYELAIGVSYTGEVPPFQFNPGPSIIYPLITTRGMNSILSVRGFLQPVAAPEPSTLALIGLGAVTLLMVRRRM